MTVLSKEGVIKQEGSAFVVRMQGATHLAKLLDVECENPEKPEPERIYRKTFHHKPIYMPRHYEAAVTDHLSGNNVVVLGMNGYSSIKPEQCVAWAIAPGAYEMACRGILKAACQQLRELFEGVDIRLAHGASNVGVDSSIIGVARELNLKNLGHSCPRFMFYVEDDDVPVYVARSQADYADAFIRSLKVLIAANGRAQAFHHDISAAFLQQKYVIPINVLQAISPIGGPKAFGDDGRTIQDAVAAFELLVRRANRMINQGGDPYVNLVADVCSHLSTIVRSAVSPDMAFEHVSVDLRLIGL